MSAAAGKGNNTRKNNRRNAPRGIYVPENSPDSALGIFNASGRLISGPPLRGPVNLPVERPTPPGPPPPPRSAGASTNPFNNFPTTGPPTERDQYGKLDYSKLYVTTESIRDPRTNALSMKQLFLKDFKLGILDPDTLDVMTSKIIDNFDETGRYIIAVSPYTIHIPGQWGGHGDNYLILYDNHGQKYRVLTNYQMRAGTELWSFPVDNETYPVPLPPILIDQIKLMVHCLPNSYDNKDVIEWSPTNHIAHL